MSPQNCDMGTKQKPDSDQTPKAKPEALQRVAAGMCLSCDDSPPKKRGLCPSCYQQFNRGKKSGVLDENDLIERGLLLPDGQFGYGRKPKGKSRLLDLIKEKNAAAMAPLKDEAMKRETDRAKRKK